MRRLSLLSLVFLAAGALLIGCSSSSPGGGSSQGPIKLGAVASLTGVAAFPYSTSAAEAVFNQVNRQGGINGRKIDYIVADDAGSPTQGSAAARKLVNTDGVVAMVGATSLADCTTDGTFYQTMGISVLQGVGIDAGCFNSPAIASVNTGPYYDIAVALYYLSQVEHLPRVCLDLPNAGIPISAYQPALDIWKRATGKTLTAEVSAPINDDPAPGMAELASDGCKGVVLATTTQTYPEFLSAASAAGLTSAGHLVMGVSSAYTQSMPAAMGAQGQGFLAAAEFQPFTSDDAAVQPYLSLMKSAGLTPSAFGEAGYVAAEIMVAALKTIKGPITKASVSAALRARAYPSSLLAKPFKWSTQPNKSLIIVEIHDGKWIVPSKAWITLG